MKKISYQEKIVAFYVSKNNNIIANSDGEDFYIKDEDISDIRAWSNDIATHIWRRLKRKILSDCVEGLFSDTCGHCIYVRKTKIKCNECSYGIRYGDCEDPRSNWRKLRRKYQGAFTSTFYMLAVSLAKNGKSLSIEECRYRVEFPDLFYVSYVK